jgi:hypothetical protein
MIEEEYNLMQRIIPLLNIQEYSYYDKKMLKYDKNVCSVCKNYCYLAYVKCIDCKRNYCTHHLPKSCCQPVAFKLMLREPNEDRLPLLGLLGKAVQVLD